VIFGEVPLDQAQGLVLAHGITLGRDRLIKGRVLAERDMALLRAHGVASVTGARIEPDDLDENRAARRVAEALAGAGIVVGPASTGRCNLFAAAAGLARIDRAAVERLNRIDEAVTVATVQPWSVVAGRQRIATVKIIPFAVPAAVTEACADAAAATGGALGVAAFRPLRLGLVVSRPAGDAAPAEDISAVTRARIEALGGSLDEPVPCPHRPDALEDAIRRALAAGCDVLAVSAAAVTTDRRDMVPQAVTRLGGRIEHFGMPVEPGNLLLLARIGGVPVLVLPGCARRADLNGLDLILRRLAAGLPVRAADIMEMGVGGLLD
jgi:molybdenum cofactor cytidylyltransferase